MLKKEDNELLTRVGPGTPGGDLMRRYWHPIALSEELKGDPLPIRALGENLVLFRDEAGQPALIDRYCPHRRVDLSYGRIEGGALRCLYHGWLMSGTGRCLEQPGEPAGSSYKDRIQVTSYPCREAGGMIFTCMAEGAPPVFPVYEFFGVDPDRYYVTKQYHACNYLQALEGYVDPAHLSYLHRFEAEASPDAALTALLVADEAPKIELEETEYGLRLWAIRKAGPDAQYVRVTNFVMPNVGAFVGDAAVDPATGGAWEGYTLNWASPVDDVQHYKFVVNFRTDGPIDMPYQQSLFADIDPANGYRSPRCLENRYLQDRSTMDRIYSGMGDNFFDQDKYAVETMGPIVDRSKENLGATDRVIIAMRRRLLAAVHDVMEGKDPLFYNDDPNRDMLHTLVVRAISIPADRDPHSLIPQREDA